MENDKRKRGLFLIGSIIVAIMFVTSYAAFGNGNGPSTTSTTIISGQTIAAFGTVNAIVTGYGKKFTITLGKNISTDSLNITLSNMQSNGSISSFLYQQNAVTLYSGSISAYSLLRLLEHLFPSNSIIANVSENVTLPSSIKLYYYGRPIEGYIKSQDAVIYRSEFSPLGSNLSVHIAALVFPNNGTVESYIVT